MSLCARCGKETHGSTVHSCTPPYVYAFEGLLKRLDKLERFKLGIEPFALDPHMISRRKGEWIRFEQVKTIIGQWVADQKEGTR